MVCILDWLKEHTGIMKLNMLRFQATKDIQSSQKNHLPTLHILLVQKKYSKIKKYFQNLPRIMHILSLQFIILEKIVIMNFKDYMEWVNFCIKVHLKFWELKIIPPFMLRLEAIKIYYPI